jgi:hypothetical protein
MPHYSLFQTISKGLDIPREMSFDDDVLLV